MSVADHPTSIAAPATVTIAEPLRTTLPPRKRPGGRGKFVALALVLAAALGVGAYAVATRSTSTSTTTVLTYRTVPETFDVKIPLTGELKAIRNVEIRSQVEGTTTITWIIPEGTRVQEGDLLVKLASDQIRDKYEDFKIRVENDRAAEINAEELLKIQENQNGSDLGAAELNSKITRMDYEQFTMGDAPVQEATFKTALENAEIDLKRKTDDRARVKELFEKKYVTGNDVLDSEMAWRTATNALNTARANLEVWTKYTKPKQEQTLKRKMDESANELERVKSKAAANLMLRKADLFAKRQTRKVDEDRLEALAKQLANCEIKASQGGMVVYQSSVGGGGWNNQGPIEEGAQVRLNQTLIQLPDTSRMQAEVRLAEQLIERVTKGMEATVTVDAFPGKVFHGKVESIATLPDNSFRWLNQNLKEYITLIPLQEAIDQSREPMKPGMTAKVEIQVRHLEDVIAVPTQALFSSGGKPYVFVGSAVRWEKRNVTTGASSATKVEITKGLSLGEEVLLSRPKNAPEDASEAGGKGKRKRSDKNPGTTAPASQPASPPAAPAATPPAVAPAGKLR